MTLQSRSAVNYAILACVMGAAALGVSLYSQPSCACLSPGQYAAGKAMSAGSEAEQRDYLARRYPAGMTAPELRERLSPTFYDRYCRQEQLTVSCTLPYDSNAWRRRQAQLVFAFDEAKRLRSATFTPLVRYAWQ